MPSCPHESEGHRHRGRRHGQRGWGKRRPKRDIYSWCLSVAQECGVMQARTVSQEEQPRNEGSAEAGFRGITIGGARRPRKNPWVGEQKTWQCQRF